jgi:pimeloyl-ACP methyl ester carboxylesterase
MAAAQHDEAGMRRRGWSATALVPIMLAWGVTGSVAASARLSPSVTVGMQGSIPPPAPCDGTSPDVQLGHATPVLLVHGFREDSTVFTKGSHGSPSLVSAIRTALGSQVQTAVFDYRLVNTAWVTNALIGPSLASCVTWLAQRSDAQGGPGRVIIVAHSMGGLAVRCALDATCGTNANGPSADPKLVGLVVTLGTPNTGSHPQYFPPGIDAVVQYYCSSNPACDDLLIARTSQAAQAMAPGSHDLAALPWLPPGVPVDALAGDLSFTANLFGWTRSYDVGDGVVPVDSAQAIARDGTGQLRPSAQAPTPIPCGSVPIDAHIGDWGKQSLAMRAPAPPLTCWHLTETTDPAWQSMIIAAIKPAAQALSLRACTAPAISAALASKDPASAAQRTLVTFACNSGWAVAEIHQPLTLSDGSVVQDTGVAILQQTDTAWTSEGLGDGTCLHAGLCPGYALPPPAILQLVLQKAGLSTATTRAELYINTAFTPGALYPFPSGPAKIGIDNHDYIDNLQWAAGSQGDLIGNGTLHYDDCNPDCASGTYQAFPVQITASNPQQCSVQLYPNGLGNPSQTAVADVFNRIDIQAPQGNPPSFLTGTSLFPGPCTQPAG